MRYPVNIKKTEEGYAVWVPGLPGCWSQGLSEDEALENIKEAIQDYLYTVITIPRANPVDAFTMAGIIKDSGMTVEEFKELL